MKIKKKSYIMNNLKFAAINPYITTNIISPEEKEIRSQDFVEFGDRNEYPNYVYDIYLNCATLHSIITGTNDFICGDEIKNNLDIMKSEMDDFVYDLGLNILIYGGAYIEVLRNKFGNIVKLNVLNYRNVRSNKDNTKFYYSKGFSEKKSYGRCKCQVYDAFNRDDNTQMQSIYMIKNIRTQVYPSPIWCASILAAEIERNINKFHLNNLSNGFAATTVINFNNGVPTDEIKEEIEKNINEKFSGTENSGRIMVAFNDDKEHAVDIATLDLKDYGEQYKTLAERSRNEIFTAFRANENLFGINKENIGFNEQEFKSSFKLYNKTVVYPLQKKIKRALDFIFNIEDSIEIIPFHIKFEEGGEV